VPVVDGSVEGVLLVLVGIGLTWFSWMLLANRNGRGTRFMEIMNPIKSLRFFSIETYRKGTGWIWLISGSDLSSLGSATSSERTRVQSLDGQSNAL
jgi:hypothetical protein